MIQKNQPLSEGWTDLFADHPCTWRSFRYVYPTISRRARGVSLGINLNRDFRCPFDCIYCQIKKPARIVPCRTDLERLAWELTELTRMVFSGEIFQWSPFDRTPSDLRHLMDWAFSGDGEPTVATDFKEAVERLAPLKDQIAPEIDWVLISCSAGLNRPDVKSAIDLMAQHQGRFWLKLDAGTPEGYQQVNRSRMQFTRILTNILSTARRHPIIVQSLFCRWQGILPNAGEISAWQQRLLELKNQGAQIQEVHLTTVARATREPEATAVRESWLKRIAEQTQIRTGIPVRTFAGRPA